MRDVVGHIDASYRTIAREGGRAVLGKSSGGFGAMHLVMEHPGVFAAFASHSGDSYFPYAHIPAFASAQRMLEKHDFSIEAFVEAFERKHKRPQPEYVTMEMLGYAAAYSPRSARAFDFDLPFDLHRGELREDVLRVGARSIRQSASPRARLNLGDCAYVIWIAVARMSTGSTSGHAWSPSVYEGLAWRCGTRSSTTTIATLDTDTKSPLPALAGVLDKE